MTDRPPTNHRAPRRGPLLAIGGALLSLAVLALVLVGIASSGPPPPGAGGYITTPPAAVTPPATAVVVVPGPLPVAIRIPKLEVASDLIETGIAPDGTAEVPPVDQPLVASWMTVSPRPGEQGPAVLLGHVDGGGQPGVFHRLGELVPGDEVLIDRDQAPAARFEVYRVEQVAKDRYPTERVYGDTPGAELRLVTCGGTFDRATGHYRSNVVAYARLAAAPPTT